MKSLYNINKIESDCISKSNSPQKRMKMNGKWILWAIVLVVIPLLGQAQTGLYVYDGGYFLRNGNVWTEYRPGNKDGVWATYNQLNEKDNNYYHIKNSVSTMAIPKTADNNFYIYNNGNWEIVYYTKAIYNYFNDNSRHIYCYKGGYFVKDGITWREYRPGNKDGVWATYNQLNEKDNNYYHIKNSVSTMAIPKTADNNFYIYNNGNWEIVYYTTCIYDIPSNNDSTFMFLNSIMMEDEEDNKAVAFIQNYLPLSLKNKFTKDDLYYIHDLIKYHMDDETDEEGYINIDKVVEYVVKQAAEEGEMGPYDPKDIFFVVQGEIEYTDRQFD